ncbi:hypothetical protein RRG08_064612 [Elysia crispata]|uniref:Uncharacterized protein n=1 Tax=Elysia crispata TaxID=231223 RepID=A0AAE1EDH7_9GAST|nr:hypothetical protein RRG08_064612 [Elysia crispata]
MTDNSLAVRVRVRLREVYTAIAPRWARTVCLIPVEQDTHTESCLWLTSQAVPDTLIWGGVFPAWTEASSDLTTTTTGDLSDLTDPTGSIISLTSVQSGRRQPRKLQPSEMDGDRPGLFSVSPNCAI